MTRPKLPTQPHAGKDPLAALRALHAEVDRAAAALAALHAPRLRCGRGCSACCVDGLTVFELEAERIREGHAELLERGSPHSAGACAFLDAQGACRIYADRPYVCRTQGLPLRWLSEAADGQLFELRDICELNAGGPPLEQLAPQQLWQIGPVEQRLAALQRARDGGAGPGRRVALRALFGRADAGGPAV